MPRATRTPQAPQAPQGSPRSTEHSPTSKGEEWELRQSGLALPKGATPPEPDPRRCYHIQVDRVKSRSGYRCRGCKQPVWLKTIFLTAEEKVGFEAWQKTLVGVGVL